MDGNLLMQWKLLQVFIKEVEEKRWNEVRFAINFPEISFNKVPQEEEKVFKKGNFERILCFGTFLRFQRRRLSRNLFSCYFLCLIVNLQNFLCGILNGTSAKI